MNKTKRRTTGKGEETELKKTEELSKPISSNQEFKFGIQFLPGNIKGLQTKLNYLLAEYRAGNIFATRYQLLL